MKKLILYILMLLPLWVAAQSTGLPNTLLVTLSDGSTQQYPLHTSPEISFDGTDMVIVTGDATVVITRDDIARYEFRYVDYSSVESVTTDSNLVRHGNDVYISNVRAGMPVTLYSIDGRQLLQTTTDERGEACLSLDRLGRGIYLLTVNRFTTKIIKQ